LDIDDEDDEADVKLPEVELVELVSDKGSVAVCKGKFALLLFVVMRLEVGEDDEDLDDFVDAVDEEEDDDGIDVDVNVDGFAIINSTSLLLLVFE
jgi:hypothetical protein